MSIWKKPIAGILSLSMLLAAYGPTTQVAGAVGDYQGPLNGVQDAKVENGNVVIIDYNNGIKGKVTFLEEDIFRFNVDPTGVFSEYAEPRDKEHVARIQQYPDSSSQYKHPSAQVSNSGNTVQISCGSTVIELDKATAQMTVKKDNKVVLSEKAPLTISSGETVQTLDSKDNEYFFGGGTQNGRFTHKGEKIQIANTNSWVDGGVASPNPFYWSTNGYGVLRNTFAEGTYDFERAKPNTVTATHGEGEFDAYYFVSSEDNVASMAQDLLGGYFKVTGSPVLLPEYGFYLGHLNCYNRDGWATSDQGKAQAWTIKGDESASSGGTTEYEHGRNNGYVLPENIAAETLNGEGPTVHAENFKPANTERKYSAQQVIDNYEKYDMPLGWFLPNDGYGCGYGQNGYQKTGGVGSQERLAAIAANVDNLKKFTDYANSKGVNTGLWTQSNLTPDPDPKLEWQKLRDFEAEVKTGGITTLKTDVAWVGSGYSFGLNGIKTAYDIVTKIANVRPNIVTLDGWAGTQRFGSIWTGDQSGGNWEYIRFHIPTYIGQSLSGNPNIGSDMDGIFRGAPVIATRDYQWKTFTPQMLDMDGWGSYVKSPYTHGDPYTGISRMYLKMKAQLMPYIYTSAASAANIYVRSDDTALPMIRAMFLEDTKSDYAKSKAVQYQYMFGDSFLVAPVYQNTLGNDDGNDVRNNIYLPDQNQVWIDYFTGAQYRGGQVLNNFDAPLWKLPLFVKNGAIIPMYEEHNNPEPKTSNNPKGLDKTQRIFEFYPSGDTSYTLYEDDGKSIRNTMSNEGDYGVVDSIDYNGSVLTDITSSVKGDTATLEVEKSKGNYTNYDPNRNTKFVINVSQKPAGISVYNNGQDVTPRLATSLDDFNKANDENVWFYDEHPQLNKYSAKGEEFNKINVTSTPKVYVKFQKTDVSQNSQKVVVYGFKNEGNLGENKLDPSLAVPTGLTAEPFDDKNPNYTSVNLNWQTADQAQSYELEVDGMLFDIGKKTEFKHTDLKYDSDHKYRIRSRDAKGNYSNWSSEVTVRTLDNPYRNVPTPEKITWTGNIYADRDPERAFDKELQTGDGGFHSGDKAINEKLTADYGNAYRLERIEYHPRDDASNGTVTKMRVETSLDGNHWIGNEYTWPRDASAKVIPLKNVAARYVRFIPLESAGNFFSAREILVFKEDGTDSFAVGSNLMKENVSNDDYTNMKNYLGVSTVFDANNFKGQIKSKYADLNNNDIYDVYDYTFTMAKLDGGTKQNGAVAGKSHLVPSAATVHAGEVLTVELKAEGGKNINAFGALVPYDTAKYEFVDGSIKSGEKTKEFENLSINKTNGTQGMINVAFANRGDKTLFSGSDVLATFQVKAKVDGPALTSEDTIIIGPKFDFVKGQEGGDTPQPESDEIPLDQFTATAGSEEPGGEPLSNAFDDNPLTNWSTKWNENIAPEDAWVEFALKAPTTVGAIRYLPRSDGGKYGIIKKAEVKIPSSTNENEWVSIGTAEWTEDAGWKTVSFDPVTVSKIRLYSVESIKTHENKNTVSAAELRLIKGKEKDPDGGSDGGTTPDKPSKIDTIPTVPGKPESIQGYKDVQNHWAQDAIAWAVTNNLFKGISDMQFAPDNAMTRGMLVTVLHRLAGKPSTGQNTFSDVPANAYFADAVAWADEVGVVTGIGENRFAPNANITREQLAVILYRFAGAPEVKDASIKFADAANVSAWAKDAVAWAVDEGILSGMEDGTLAPKGQATRAQVATILMRYEQSNHKSE